jgi:hypothetical protein
VRGQRRDAAFRNSTELARGTEIHALPQSLVGQGGFGRVAFGALSADYPLGLSVRRSGHMTGSVTNAGIAICIKRHTG